MTLDGIKIVSVLPDVKVSAKMLADETAADVPVRDLNLTLHSARTSAFEKGPIEPTFKLHRLHLINAITVQL